VAEAALFSLDPPEEITPLKIRGGDFDKKSTKPKAMKVLKTAEAARDFYGLFYFLSLATELNRKRMDTVVEQLCWRGDE
jgi:hypothetical protein